MADENQAYRAIECKLDGFYENYVRELDLGLRRLYRVQSKELIHKLVPLKNHLNFSLYNPLGRFRGRWDSPHHYGKEVVIDAVNHDQTSTGFLSGPLLEGNWIIELETHGICSEEVTYELEVWYHQEEVEYNWYRGELHLHSHHSDGKASLVDLGKVAKENKLDFFALSDHNTISGWKDICEDEVVIIPSIELSSYFGHAVALGIKTYIDWRTESTEDNITEKIKQIHSQGGLFSLAHPFTIGKPICMGCEWEYSQLPWHQVDLIEIWVRDWKNNIIQNTLARKLWEHKLNQGFKITAIASNDLHDPQDYQNNTRLPFTYVKAEQANKEHILNALKRGKAYISSGPEIEFKAKSENNTVLGEIGDILKSSQDKVKLSLLITKIEVKAEINLYRNGKLIYTEDITYAKEKEIIYIVEAIGYSYYYWEIKDKNNGEVLLLSNPIFFEEGDE